MRKPESDGTAEERSGDDSGSSWYRPLGPPTSVRRLIDLVVERLAAGTGPGPTNDRTRRHPAAGFEVDVRLGVVRSLDRRWAANLAPLASQLADIPPGGWSLVVDREIERWRRAAAAVGQTAEAELARVPEVAGRHHPPAVVRLTTLAGPAGRTLRPAFGDIAWELVRDLGPDGLAALTATSSHFGDDAELRWEQHAARTVTRFEDRWAHLNLDGGLATILSGPHVSALIFDPHRLRDRLDGLGQAAGLRVTVFTNSLLLATTGGDRTAPATDLLAHSLQRFASAGHRNFDPFTVDVTATGAAANTVTPT